MTHWPSSFSCSCRAAGSSASPGPVSPGALPSGATAMASCRSRTSGASGPPEWHYGPHRRYRTVPGLSSLGGYRSVPVPVCQDVLCGSPSYPSSRSICLERRRPLAGLVGRPSFGARDRPGQAGRSSSSRRRRSGGPRRGVGPGPGPGYGRTARVRARIRKAAGHRPRSPGAGPGPMERDDERRDFRSMA